MKKMVIALACLLFLTTHVVAQSESQATDEESLRGLKGVALSIMLTRGGALDETQRVATLKLLQDDAKVRFQKAGILLLEFTQGVKQEPDSPRLLITVTMEKRNGHSYQVVSQSKLVQNVRLSRDPSIQINVTTWTAFSVGDGYDITDRENLRQQVGNDVAHFIKAYLEVNPK
jgi:hypothetical protein